MGFSSVLDTYKDNAYVTDCTNLQAAHAEKWAEILNDLQSTGNSSVAQALAAKNPSAAAIDLDTFPTKAPQPTGAQENPTKVVYPSSGVATPDPSDEAQNADQTIDPTRQARRKNTKP